MDIDNPPWGAESPGRADDVCPERQSSNSANGCERQAKPALRPYQVDVVDRVNASIAAGRNRILLTMVTGAGKTVVAAHLINEAVQRGELVLFVAHRHELITQASRKLSDEGVHDHGIIKAGFPTRLLAPVQVASVQTVHVRVFRSQKIELARFKLIIIDEAHHARAKTYQHIVDAFPDAVIIGLTATPCRGDGRGLGNIFEELIEGPGVTELIAQEHLVGTKVFAPSRPDLSGVHTRQGDYVVEELATAMDKQALVGDVVTHWLKHAEGRRTVVFGVNVARSVHLRDAFRDAGILAEHIDGTTPLEERNDILAKLSAGDIRVVCNCAVLTEGWDQPEVSCIVLARPTKQLGMYRQMVGRVLRPAPGKADSIVLDHSGAVFEHGFAEDPIVWTLKTDEKAENRAHLARKAEQHTRGLTTCPGCSAVRVEGAPCGSCGWRPQPKPRYVEFQDGDLGQVNRDKSVHVLSQDQQAFYQQLMALTKQYGHKPGAAAHKFNEKFGRFPPRSWNDMAPLSPTPEVRSWFQSRRIAYVKATQAQR